MEYAASKASSKPPTLASSASSTHSTKPNGQTPTTPQPETDDDPRTQLIDSLRTQLTDIHTQLSQLNSKLVQSYDRVSHLEDTLEVANDTVNASKARISELEAQKSAHEAALETGVLVEREHVAHELSRLMEKATEEAAQRGEADAARSRIETELDDLSADLFGRANTMVAEARIARAASERRVVDAETALKGAELAVQSMQVQMQQMAEARRAAEEQAAEMRARMDKGKWIDRDEDRFRVDAVKRRFYNNHNVYREFVMFVAHLRGLRATNGGIPQLSTLASVPFLARLIVEDCDPTLRLDLAPALNWLNRRAVHTAILQGQLEIEPVYGLLESECALCGLGPHGPVTPSGSAATSPTTASHTLSPRSQSAGATSMAAWASTTSKYLKGSLASPTTTPPVHQTPVAPLVQRAMTDPNAPPIYIFRIAGAQATTGAAPLALCSGGWCLARLRATCELCSFLKHSVVDKVWAEPPMASAVPPPTLANNYIQGLGSMVSALRDKDKDATPAKEKDTGDAPPVPPRRRQLSSLGSSIWEKGLGAFGGSRSGSRSGTPAPEETKEISPKLPHRVPPPLTVPNDAKPAAAPPPPPPRARPVPPPPVVTTTDPEPKPEPEEHHEEIQHATVFDAAADEHGHHAISPMTDKRHSVPPPLRAPSPKLDPVPLPSVGEPTAAAEPASNEPPAPAAESEAAPAPAPVVAPQTPPRPPPIARPPRNRHLPHDTDKPPMSPRTVTLPDSRPGTPAPEDRPSTPSPLVAARAISPPPGSSPLRQTGSLRRDGEPGRASSPAPGDSPAPPKIPRRAPRRAAPVPPGTPSAPSAALNAEKTEEKENKAKEEKPEEDATKVEKKASTEEKPVVARPPRRAVPPPPAPPLPPRADSPKPVEQKLAEDGGPTEETKPDDSSKPIEVKPAEETEPAETKAVEETKPSERRLTEPAEPATEKARAPVTTMVTSATEDNLAQSEPTTALPPTSDKPTEEKRPTPEAANAGDDAHFVGDQTWEDRAYKEIVKLREDMFWARIGSAW
ncbi:hypothetical protein FRC09_000926 [Ceratobasidium sp. 395]|nr:hypothetical protein FRC09_000926 [Ceratobasidium sp. 395]